MRWIRKRLEPRALTEWRARCRNDINFGYDLMRKDGDVTSALEAALRAEQGGLCAYTGRRIESGGYHVEHVNAQARDVRGEDVDYGNMVACYPAPNTGRADYGAHPKEDWPRPEDKEQHLFVSPLMPGCEGRFGFNLRGEISASSAADEAAKKTVEKLKLDHKALTDLRQGAIRGTLGLRNDLHLDRARGRLRQLEEQEAQIEGGNDGQLEPYCFALKQALRRHITRVEAIRANRKSDRKNS